MILCMYVLCGVYIYMYMYLVGLVGCLSFLSYLSVNRVLYIYMFFHVQKDGGLLQSDLDKAREARSKATW